MDFKNTLLKRLLFIAMFIISISAYSQALPSPVPFTPKPEGQGTFSAIKGDMLLIGNNILNRQTATNGPNVPYNGSLNNNDFTSPNTMDYIDIDGDPTTFSSSSANLTIPSVNSGCYTVRYAALYWAGMYKEADVNSGRVNRANFDKVKLKLPGAGAYNNITGNVIYDSNTVDLSGSSRGYVSFAEVTALIQGLADANGTYTVADLIAGSGSNTSAGWTLYIVYSDPLATAKNITLFNGFSAISGTNTLNIPITGFTTIPVGPVRAKLAFSSLEGDFDITGDRLRINGSSMTIPTRIPTNFFNSSINDINGAFTARVPNSTNLLGFDAGIINVPNPGNGVIANGDTAATVRLESSGDAYFYYMNAFAIEIIQPSINLIKIVRDLALTNIANATVSLGQELYYDLDFQNIGNDGATGFTITDVLPTNVDFIEADLIVPPGVTYVYNLATHTIVFTIPDNLVTQGGANYQIRIKVRVLDDCNNLRDACSNEIRNQAFKTYSSLNSGNVVENGEPSASGINSCLILEPGTTNFLADIDDCTFTRDEVLCGSNVVLTAGSGYLTYQWHSGAPPTAANAIAGATNQSYTATALGTYSVVNTAPAPCLTIVETINVVDFNGVVSHPIVPFADQVDTCANTGALLPKIFLCGATDSQLIQTNILNASSIVWELWSNDTSCTAADVAPPSTCPDDRACVTWVSAGPNGPNFNAVNAGQYRVTVTFQNGCFRTYYFNVYKTVFTPTETHSDIICGTNGNITVNGVPASYEFSLTGLAGSWQTSNSFTITTAGTYTVYIQQIGGGGVGNCIFTLPNIQIINRNFTVNVIVANALCNNAFGSIRVQVNNVNPQYTYTLYQGATLISSAGPINPNDYTFSNLIPGTYTVNASTVDGCAYSQTVTITNPPILTTTAAITIPLTCNPGQITVYPVGGTPPYTYTISGTAGFQAVPEFEILTAGTYTFTVTDFNGCTATTNTTINVLPPPVFTVTQTNVLCYGDASGAITFNVTNTNGYTLLYSIDNGVTFSSNPVFSNLAVGSYETLVQYSLAGSVCLTTAQTIVISGPLNAVTASAGVSELAGCGPMGEGKILISNPQGGVPGYQYSFDGGITWGAINEMYLLPGTYSVCVRDTNLCVFCTNVTIDPAPPAPTISLVGPNYNCDGTGNVTATTNSNGGNFSYLYYLDGVLNTPSNSNVFSNIPCGPHNISIEYLNLTPPTTLNNLLLEDFGQGANTTSPGIDSGFCWETQNPPSTCGNGIQINEQDYVVTRRIQPIPNVWNDARDHTTNGANINGRFLCVNLGSPSTGRILYSRTINSIIPNVNVQVSLWAMTLLQLGNTGQEPNLTVELVRDLGLASETIVSTMSTASIPKTVNTWRNYIMSLNPGNNTSLSFVIKSYSVIPPNEGVGVVIDDINLFQTPRVCSNTVTYPVFINCGQAFTAQVTSTTNVSCNGAANGQITIAAQNFGLPYGFDYSTNGGTTWTNSTTSPVTITGLAANTYNIVIRYNNAAPTCSFPFTQIITQPAVLVASASLSSPATCISGGTITASASGGTLNYQYQLQNGVGGVLVAYQANPVFTNLAPGTYVVVVRDALGCTDSIDVSIVIPTPVNPTATVAVTSDLCYDGTNAATIIVAASGGVPPYRYSLNGGTSQGSDTFSGLTPGTYTIVVTDSYGCTFTMPAVTIRPQLTANVVLTSNLNCTASPNAIISGTITGGTTPYSYQVSYNGGALSAPVAVVGSTFTHNAPTAGTYQFTITDAIGCTYISQIITVNPLPILNKPVLAITSQIRCFGDATAAISVTPSGGLPPYTINVLNTTTGFNYGTQTSGLTAGSYTVTITDANSCTAFETIIISQPAAIAFTSSSVNIQCGPGGTEPGSIDISAVTGGTSPYTYIVTNSTGTYTDTFGPTLATSHSFVILNFGIYTVTVVDANGCQLSRTNTVASPPSSLTINPIIIPTTDCLAGGSIQVCVNTPTPLGPYFFAIYVDLAPAIPGYPTFPVGYQPADITDPTGLCSTFTGLTPGVTYSFIVYDQGTNCYYFETATSPVDTNSLMVVSNDAVANVTCTGADDGNVSFTFSGYSGTSVSYQIFNSVGNAPVLPILIGTSSPIAGPITIPNFGPLAPGQYYILLTENDGPNAGCSITSPVFTIVESPLELDLVVNVTKNDNCNVNAGQITVTGLNGTPAYSYQILPAGTMPAPIMLTWAGQASNIFNVEGGTYDIYIKDAFNCIRSALAIFVPTDTSPNISLTLEASTLCNASEGSYSITVTRDNTAGIAPFTYSVDGSAFTTYTEDASFSFLLTGLNSGLHTVTIQDANGCSETETITISPPLSSTVTPTIAVVQNCGASDGIITVNATGGTGVYTYSISPNPAVITLVGNVFSNVPANTYTITVTDATTMCTFDIPVTLATPDAVTFTATPTDVTCNTGTDGSISIALTGATSDPVYMYEITAPIVRAPQTSNVFSGLALGNYTVVVTSGRGCSATQVVPVGEPAAVTITPLGVVVTPFSCTTGNTTSNATIEVNGVTGGSGTYINYEFILGGTVVQSGTNNTYTESNPLGGLYTINVYDNNGCVGTINATIAPFVSIVFSGSSVTVTQPITCAVTENITVNVTVTGGAALNLEYIVTGLGGNPYNVTQNNPNFTGLTIGNYNITVINLDTGCSIQTTHLVFNPNTFIVTAAVTSNVICHNSNTGTATLTFIDQVVPTDEAGPFQYTVIHQGSGATVASGTSASITQNLTGLIAGIYEVQTTLVASPECPAVTNFTITQPAAALTISATSTRITCILTNDDGTISASALNGWGAPYEFQLEETLLGVVTPWSSVSNFTNLGPGNYTVSVRDLRGCVVFTNVVLTIPTAITGTINASADLLCVGDTNASITITGVSGGEGANYLYTLTNTATLISTAPQTSNVFNDLGAGTYEVTISDSFTCQFTTGAVTINEPADNVAGLLAMTTPPTCTTGATLTLTGSGGTAPYRYSTTLGGPYLPVPATFTNVAPGTYQYYIIDDNNCILDAQSNPITVLPVLPIVVDAVLDNAVISCFGETGSITVSATDGLGNYIYVLTELVAPTPIVTTNTTGIFNGLPVGNYSLVVTSGDCTSTPITFTIDPVLELEIVDPDTDIIIGQQSCLNRPFPLPQYDAYATVNPSGGTPPYYYSITPHFEVQNSNTFDNLAPGIYTIRVIDSNGCQLEIAPFEINQLLPFSLDNLVIQDELCIGDGGSVSFQINGGTDSGGSVTPAEGYTLTFNGTMYNSPTGDFNGTNVPEFANLPAGFYEDVLITDDNGCEFLFNITIAPGLDIQAGYDVVYPCTGTVPTNILTVSYNPSIALADLTFTLDSGTPQASNVFNNTITPGNHVITVTHTNTCSVALPVFVDSFAPLTLTLAETGLNIFTATTTGGLPAYEYTLNGNYMGSTNVFQIYQTGVYTVTVTDANGCVATASIPMTFYDIVIPDYFTPDGDGTNDGWGPQFADNFPNIVTYVFDRYSRVIITLKQGETWDGTYNNNKLPSGDYWYVIKLNGPTDAREFVGNFTLYR